MKNAIIEWAKVGAIYGVLYAILFGVAGALLGTAIFGMAGLALSALGGILLGILIIFLTAIEFGIASFIYIPTVSIIKSPFWAMMIIFATLGLIVNVINGNDILYSIFASILHGLITASIGMFIAQTLNIKLY